jgi:ATP-dependent DNA helicase RecG
LLRYGRPAPDYSRSDATSVILCMSNAESDMDFLEPIIQEENRQGASMPLDSLIILSRLRQERRISINDIVSSTQKSEQDARRTIEKLTELGLVEAHCAGRGRTYTLSAEIYRKVGKKSGYIRQTGFDPIQQEQKTLNYIDNHDTIKRAEAMELCRITKDQAYKLLARMNAKEWTHYPKRYAKGCCL